MTNPLTAIEGYLKSPFLTEPVYRYMLFIVAMSVFLVLWGFILREFKDL